MKAHIVLAHPESKSFNGQLAKATRSTLQTAGWEVTLSDLYTDGFDPLEGPGHYQTRADSERFHAQTEQRFHADNDSTPQDVVAEKSKLLQADLLVVHFPLWWFGMPAMLKGWIDRVFVYGAVYRGQMRYNTGICRGKKMLACITTGASEASCSFNGREGDSRLHAWPLLFPFRYIGFDVLEPVFFHGVGGVASIEADEDGLTGTDLFMQQWVEVLTDLDDRGSTPYNTDDDFDENKQLNPGAPVFGPFISHRANTPWD